MRLKITIILKLIGEETPWFDFQGGIDKT